MCMCACVRVKERIKKGKGGVCVHVFVRVKEMEKRTGIDKQPHKPTLSFFFSPANLLSLYAAILSSNGVFTDVQMHVAVCCSVLQCVAVRGSVLHRVAGTRIHTRANPQSFHRSLPGYFPAKL